MKNSIIQSSLLVAVLGLLSLTSYSASAEFAFDLGIGQLSPKNSNGDIEGLGIPPMSSVDVDKSNSIAATLHYFSSEQLSYQLYLAPPIEFDINATGNLQPLGTIATVDVLLPTVMVNYHFTSESSWTPYLGAGLNYTLFSNTSSTSSLTTALGGETDIDMDNSFGVALQAGVHFRINKQWYINANYLWISVDSTATTRTSGVNRTVELGLDPSVYYLSLGYRF